eukprot:scaffold259473_cov22-Tisochrysis_lutea.AAC.1
MPPAQGNDELQLPSGFTVKPLPTTHGIESQARHRTPGLAIIAVSLSKMMQCTCTSTYTSRSTPSPAQWRGSDYCDTP